MTYIDRLNSFRIARAQRPISANAITLYFILLEQMNLAYFPEYISLAGVTLQGLTGLGEKRLQAARSELVKNGYIGYLAGGRGAAPQYTLCNLLSGNDTDNNTEQPPIGGQTESETGDKTEDKKGVKTEEKRGDKMGVYKDKTREDNSILNNNINNNVRAYEVYEQNIGLISPIVADAIDAYLAESVEDEMICAAIGDAAKNNKRSWQYIDRIISEKLSRGIKTLNAYEYDKREWNSKKRGTAPLFFKQPDSGSDPPPGQSAADLMARWERDGVL